MHLQGLEIKADDSSHKNRINIRGANFIAILKRTDNIWDGIPLTWSLAVRKGRVNSALIVCANGHIGALSEHVIMPNGAVTPSCVCTGEGVPGMSS